ncbi:MAG: T9SS type A sorting domain-containing protein [Dysgonomonas sp.]
MKTLTISFLLFFLFILPSHGQLNSSHNHLRCGDVLIKQQVEFVDPGQAGASKLWDFSKLKTVNDAYTLSYSLPPLEGDSVYILGDKRYQKKKASADELIIGTEHHTMYYYRLSNDSLLQQGHENPTIQLTYTTPMVLIRYPLNYGQSTVSKYQSKGLYSGTVHMQTQGTMTTSADAYGKMILPSGDTINPVLRVKTEQLIVDIPEPTNTDNTQQYGNKGNLLETYRWYSKGYRYPVFETVRNINLNDSTQVFATAFYYPPQDHLYLDTDPENQALLDELWTQTEDNSQNTTDPQQTGKTVNIDDLISCRIYPNPVESIMNLEYELKEDADISFNLYTIDGLSVKKIDQKKKQNTGTYYETIDCSNLYPKNYVLRITVNNLTVNEIIIKK